MVRDICKDPLLLSLKAQVATKEDELIAQALIETLKAHQDCCVGMAANMIGVAKAIIVFYHQQQLFLMYNPTIIKKSGPYMIKERCLSWPGEKETVRYQAITVHYQDEQFRFKERSFKGFTAEIIQHEIDHLEGKAI